MSEEKIDKLMTRITCTIAGTMIGYDMAGKLNVDNIVDMTEHMSTKIEEAIRNIIK